MDPTKHNAAALHERVDKICNALIGNYTGITSSLLPPPASENDPKKLDYSSTAQNELALNEDIASLIRAGQDLSSLIRELKELWVFGGLDSLTGDTQTDQARTLKVAAILESIAKGTGAGASAEGKGKTAA
ncbi:hypothetical protein BCR34DRAFT_340695 [Clohesyomyces aquaticus]|uniref:Uncharacterized protein n=1 Tax=Clohesyomyces aquaticus TaxID=1231657 RepID=A0A1Y1ZKG5_9PLEO|nr:hypothetical protein BCR34DRAFT_340695 [Clohesyomyces aquaticus]